MRWKGSGKEKRGIRVQGKKRGKRQDRHREDSGKTESWTSATFPGSLFSLFILFLSPPLVSPSLYKPLYFGSYCHPVISSFENKHGSHWWVGPDMLDKSYFPGLKYALWLQVFHSLLPWRVAPDLFSISFMPSMPIKQSLCNQALGTAVKKFCSA